MSINKGSATVTTDKTESRAADPIKNGQSKTANDPTKIEKDLKPFNLVPNPLEQFASMTPLFTLAILTPQQFNDPSLYRTDDLSFAGDFYMDENTGEVREASIVFSSGGRGDDLRTNTAYGAPEYFVNNFSMKATVAANERTGNSNAFKFEWEIFEPYSMGLLLQSLQVAARKAGYINYLDNAPYVLRLDFQGYAENGQVIKSIKPKWFVLKLTGVKFSVTESGSVYKMEGVPYNHQGFSDVINTVYNDVKLSSSSQKPTVKELLQDGENSLASFLNGIEDQLLQSKRIGKKDVYEIQFPDNSSVFQTVRESKEVEKRASKNPNSPPRKVVKGTNAEVITDFLDNPIGRGEFGFSQGQGGNFPFRKHDDQVDPKTGVVRRDNMVIDPKNRTFQFTQGQTLTQIINQIILSSDYAKAAMNEQAALDNNGFIKWWRVDVQIELLDFDALTGDYAKKITYRVVPFLVHHTVFANPNAAPIGYGQLKERIKKGYNYIYSGNNVDILKFDININNLFYSGIGSSSESKTALTQDPNNSGTAEQQVSDSQVPAGSAPTQQLANFGRRRTFKDPKALKKPVGGSGTTSTEQAVAESFHRSFVNGSSADLIKVNLEILGDTYWIVDSGLANYFASAQPLDQITNDGTMNYESGDVFIYISFRTPSDVNEKTGLYDFALVGKESPFSGIYRVILCESTFSEGVFKQKLECVRMPGQANEFKDLPAEAKQQQTDPKESGAVKVSGKLPPATSVADIPARSRR
jgi:hypothetical protein